MQLNIPQETITNEYRISVLEELLQWIIVKNWESKKMKLPNAIVINDIRKTVFDEMKKKYPDWLEYKGDQNEQ